MNVDQIKELKSALATVESLAEGEDKSALLKALEELKKKMNSFGEKLDEEVDLWEKARVDEYEKTEEKIKEFRKIAEEFKN